MDYVKSSTCKGCVFYHCFDYYGYPEEPMTICTLKIGIFKNQESIPLKLRKEVMEVIESPTFPICMEYKSKWVIVC